MIARFRSHQKDGPWFHKPIPWRIKRRLLGKHDEYGYPVLSHTHQYGGSGGGVTVRNPPDGTYEGTPYWCLYDLDWGEGLL